MRRTRPRWRGSPMSVPADSGTLRIPILEGRDFDERDHATSRRVLLVKIDAFVRQHLRTTKAIGTRVRTVAEAGYPEAVYEIVGVVGGRRVRHATRRGLPVRGRPGREAPDRLRAHRPGPEPAAVRSRDRASQRIGSRVDRGHQAALRGARSWIGRADCRAGAPDACPAGDRSDGGVAGRRLRRARDRPRRRRPLRRHRLPRREPQNRDRHPAGDGVHARADWTVVLRDSLWLLAVGALVGLPLAVAAMRGAGTLLFGIAATDLPTLAGATGLLVVAGALAGSLPAWRAALLPPMAAIRDEPESMWRTARATVQRAVRELTAGGDGTMAPGTLASEVAGAIHRAASFPDAVRAALDTLRERVGAQRSCSSREPATNTRARSAPSLRVAVPGQSAHALSASPAPDTRRFWDVASMGQRASPGTSRGDRDARQRRRPARGAAAHNARHGGRDSSGRPEAR